MNNNKTDLSVDPSIDLCNKKNAAKTPAPFMAQGFLENNYYFYVKRLDRIVSIKSNQFKQRYLLKLASIEYWREHFGTFDRRKQSGVDWNEVEISLMTKCYEFGEFKGAAIRTRAIRHPAKVVSSAKNVEVA
jgi:hypothetical protein